MNFAQPLSAATLVSAAVSVVLPWSMCPIVPTFTCGLLRSNFSLAMSTILVCVIGDPGGSAASSSCACDSGADVQDRTGDLVLTKDALCQLSYIGKLVLGPLVVRRAAFTLRWTAFARRLACQPSLTRVSGEQRLERETGIEPATNS